MPAVELREYAKPDFLILERNDEIYEIISYGNKLFFSFVMETDNKTYETKSGLAFMMNNGFNPLAEYGEMSMELILEAFDGKYPFDTNL